MAVNLVVMRLKIKFVSAKYSIGFNTFIFSFDAKSVAHGEY